jgi:NADH-quinone oxidoreductase subunit D
MVESTRIIGQALDALPDGPHIADDRKYVLPPRSELSTSMESLIHHFKLVTEGFRVDPARSTTRSRARAGSSAASSSPTAPRSPPGSTSATPPSSTCRPSSRMAVGGYVADMIASLGMLDPILGGVDR